MNVEYLLISQCLVFPLVSSFSVFHCFTYFQNRENTYLHNFMKLEYIWLTLGYLVEEQVIQIFTQ